MLSKGSAQRGVFACLVFSLVLTCLDGLALDKVPVKLNVQGVLRNSSGELMDGTYTIVFSIYASETASTPLYQSS